MNASEVIYRQELAGWVFKEYEEAMHFMQQAEEAMDSTQLIYWRAHAKFIQKRTAEYYKRAREAMGLEE